MLNSTETVIRAFGAEHVAKLTGISAEQLRYWDRTGFYTPEHSDGLAVYSFRDVVALRTIGILRNVHRVSLQHLRKASRELHRRRNAPWSELVLSVLNKRVYFKDPDTGRFISAVEEQGVLIELEAVAHSVAAEVNRLTERASSQIGRVERHRNVAHNDWVLAGTRISTRTIRHYVEAGFSVSKILREFPVLTEKDITAALEHENALAAA